MASQGFTDDFKHVVFDLAARSRDWLSGLRRPLRSAAGWLLALPQPVKLGMGAALAGAVLLAGALASRPEPGTTSHRSFARTASAVIADAVPRRAASKSAGSTEESHLEAKGATRSYAVAAQKGDARALHKLVALTRASSCAARSEAADALGNVRGVKSTAALKRLAASSFKDESKSPGIFSCSSRRAALKALEKQEGG